jgi:hypothetical protein
MQTVCSRLKIVTCSISIVIGSLELIINTIQYSTKLPGGFQNQLVVDCSSNNDLLPTTSVSQKIYQLCFTTN